MLGLVVANFAFAAIVNCGEYDAKGKLHECQIGDLILTINLIINTLLSWAGLVAILMVVISFNILGDGLRDALDPKTKRI
jgi:hypothetical protein